MIDTTEFQAGTVRPGLNRKILVLCALSAVLLFLRAWSDFFVYPVAALGLIVAIFFKTEIGFPYLLFMLPSSVILKINPEQISLFTVIFMVYVMRTLLRNRIDAVRMLPIVILFFYNIIFSGSKQFISNATIAIGLIMVMFVSRNKAMRFETALYAFCCGIILASVLALFKDSSDILAKFIKDTTIRLTETKYSTRFAGLQGNPNYYTMDITIAIGCLVTLMSTKKFNFTGTVLLTVMLVFGLMSVSKSFLISMCVMVLFLMLQLLRSKNLGTFVKIVAAIFVLATGVYLFAHDAIDLYAARLSSDKGAGLSIISTGRTDIWSTYITILFRNPNKLFTGYGLNNILRKGSHNAYIEIIYSLGIIGTIILAMAVESAMVIRKGAGKQRAAFIMCMPVLLYLIRIFAIGALTYDSTWYYIALLRLMYVDMSWRREYTKHD